MTVMRPATGEDLKLIWAHDQRHVAESGTNGDVIFVPREGPDGGTLDEWADPKFDSLVLSHNELGWERIWIITDEKTVFGQLTLVHRSPMKSTLHRALLMMGIERSHRGRGYGSKLMEAGIEWAKSVGLEWLTLHVFDHNEPAKALKL